MIRFGFAHHCLPKDVHREGDLLFLELAQSGDDFLFVIAEHKLPRHASDLRFDACAKQPGSPASGFQPEPQGRGERDLVIPEIFFEMAGHFARRSEHRQHIHEAEELRFEMLVLHRPIHQRPIETLLAEKRWRFRRIHQRKKFFAVSANVGLEIRGFC